MSISLVINTCANGPKAAETLSSGKQPHAQRAFVLRNFILPAALADPTFDEVIVVGEWEPGNGYIYIEVPSVHFSCVDALAQRQAGFERSRGTLIFFQHDDHMLERMPFWDDAKGIIPPEFREPHDVVVPSRYTRLRDVNGERLNGGEPTISWPESTAGRIAGYGKTVTNKAVPLHDGYISGHCAIYRREVLERCPWNDVPEKFTWDVEHTRQIRVAGFKIEWSSALNVWDVEAGSHPWK